MKDINNCAVLYDADINTVLSFGEANKLKENRRKMLFLLKNNYNIDASIVVIDIKKILQKYNIYVDMNQIKKAQYKYCSFMQGLLEKISKNDANEIISFLNKFNVEVSNYVLQN